MAGVPTVLFLQAPQPQWVQRFSAMRCIGMASTARGQSPQWMEQNLPDAFAKLRAFGAPILQYKVCSTFDSSPQLGSIGRAIDIGTAMMPGRWSPMVVGVPQLQRYQAFGNLFALANGERHRLDRHPTMRHHPVTPMLEADLKRHLAMQTQRRIELIDLVQLQSGAGLERLQAITAPTGESPVVLLDVLDDTSQALAGELVWQQRASGLFSASSSGLQYALVAHWRSQGLLPAQTALPKAEAVDAIAVVSGSCSPITATQIQWARAHGFEVLRMHIARVLDRSTRAAEIQRLVLAAVQALAQQRSPLVHSAEGPTDPAVLEFDAMAIAAGLSRTFAAQTIGEALSAVMNGILERVPAMSRVVVAGGDSAGAVAGTLNIAALSIHAQLSPGAPLCRAWSEQAGRDGLQISLKGGQMGPPDFFGKVLKP